jgi:hypothetical protein
MGRKLMSNASMAFRAKRFIFLLVEIFMLMEKRRSNRQSLLTMATLAIQRQELAMENRRVLFIYERENITWLAITGGSVIP